MVSKMLTYVYIGSIGLFENVYVNKKYIFSGNLINCLRLKPCLSMKVLSINNFTTKLLSNLLSDLYIGVDRKTVF